MDRRWTRAAAALALAACAHGHVESGGRVHAAAPTLRFDVAAVDASKDACVSFYDFACGGWRKAHPIPADRSRWSRYSEVQALNLEKERAIVEDARRAGPSGTPLEQRIGSYYAACMDEAGIESRGLSPLRDVLARIDTVRAAEDVAAVVGELHARGVFALLDLYVGLDLDDTSRTVANLDKASLGLPTRDDYLAADPKSAGLRDAYRAHVGRLAAALGASDAAHDAERLVELETTLARSALGAAARRDRAAQHHPMTRAEVRARWPTFDWDAYLDAIGAPWLDRFDVRNPAWVDAVVHAIEGPDLDAVRTYLRVRLVTANALVLPSAIATPVADFEERTLRGARAVSPRWRRCLGLVDRDVGGDVGAVFLARHFPAESQRRVTEIAARITAAFREDIARSAWLGPEGRQAALAKLEGGIVQIGASARSASTEGLVFDADSPIDNIRRARIRALSTDLAKLRRAAERADFFEALPQQLDGFGSKTANATGFTAGFLQPPTFDPSMDEPVNYGAFGAVVGHELTHQFDDEGRKFDALGRAREWWSADDVARFEERSRCFVDEYASFRSEDGTPVDARLTLGENLADNGGLRLAWAAATPSMSGPRVDGFTPAQRFFLAWGQIRCENVTPEAGRRQALHDEHAPGRARVDGVVSNMEEFTQAFGCAPGSPMAPPQRCRLW